MKTLKQCVIDKKCRKGAANGTTKRGAFWLACEPIKIRSYGGDGIGNNAADCTHFLQLRHYRDGEVLAIIHGNYWHQGVSAPDEFVCCDDILECTTVEAVIVALKGEQMPGGNSVFSDYFTGNLTCSLTELGLVENEPAPDEL